MDVPPPNALLHDQHDYHALLCSLLQPHLFQSLNRAGKLAVRGVSVQLREEADRCFSSLDCHATLKTEEEGKRLRNLSGRLVRLRSLTLRSLKAVEAVLDEEGAQHACSSGLQVLAIKLPWGDVVRMSQGQLASMCRRVGGWLRAPHADSPLRPGAFLIQQLPGMSLSLCPQPAPDLSCHGEIKDMTQLSTSDSRRELQLSGSWSIRFNNPLQGLIQMTPMSVFCDDLQPLRLLPFLKEVDKGVSSGATDVQPSGTSTRLPSAA